MVMGAFSIEKTGFQARRIPRRALACALAIAALTLVAPAALAEPAAPPVTEDGAVVFGAEDNLQGVEARPVGEGPAAAQVKPSGTPQPAYMAEDQPLKLKDYDEPKPAEPEPWWSQLLGFLLKLVIVIGLIFGTLVAMKKMNGGKVAFNLPNTRGRNIVVLETTHLNPQQAVHLISLGGERLLVVGASPQGLTTLSEITDPQQMRPFLQGQKAASASPFNQVFDLESVVQESGGELFNEAYREQYGRKGRKDWPGS